MSNWLRTGFAWITVGTACLAAEDPLTAIDSCVAEEMADGQFAGCVVLIGRSEEIPYERAFGKRQVEPASLPMRTDTVFDMASVTKPVATATSVMVLVERGRLRLGDSISRHLPEIDGPHGDEITVRLLLTHYAGYVPDNALEDYRHGVDEAWRRLFALTPTRPPGSAFQYSDVNYELLGKLVERLSGQPLNEFARENVFEPLGMTDTGFKPGEPLVARAAATEPRDGRMLVGEVHDPRAALLGGVAGHAGLFSTAPDLAKYARAMLAGGEPVLSPATVDVMTTPEGLPGQRRTPGWDHASRYSSNRGDLMSDRAFGHGGFTGTGLWIDPGNDLFVVFLSNRLHPDGKGSVNDLIGRIGNIAVAALTREDQ